VGDASVVGCIDVEDRETGGDAGLRAGRWKDLLTLSGAGSREFLFGLAELDAGQRAPLHTHRHAKIDYVLAGRGRYRVGPEAVELGAGACVYLPGGLPHAVEALGPEPFRYAYTYACERLGHGVEWLAADETAASQAPLPHRTWMRWEDTAAWQPLEPVKGLRGRFRRVMDPARQLELIAGIAEVDSGTHYTRHYHDQPELYYILAGRGTVYVGEARVNASPGSALYIGGRVVHGADSLGDEPLRIFYVYACETAGHAINWTAAEEIYTEVRRG
jgi:mannose-6-phosphate isomerase-like protein (cupin superfamily)